MYEEVFRLIVNATHAISSSSGHLKCSSKGEDGSVHGMVRRLDTIGGIMQKKKIEEKEKTICAPIENEEKRD